LAVATSLLAFASSLGAQAVSNPNLNAQLLVGARQATLAQVERVPRRRRGAELAQSLGKTALLLVAEKGNLAIVEAMLKSGADVNQASLEGVTPLMARELRRRRAGRAPPAGGGCEGTDPVDRYEQARHGLRAGQGNAGALDALLASGIDVNAAYEHRLTALMWAAGQGQVDAVKLLLRRGAQRDLRDDSRPHRRGDSRSQAKQDAAAAVLVAP